MEDKDAKVLSQDRAYRRGLVLGLTMAEIMVLILFALLLILAAALGPLKNDIVKKEDIINERDTRIIVLENLLGDILHDNRSGMTIEDIIQKIERQEESNAKLQAEIERLKPYEVSGEALKTIIQEISRNAKEKPTTQQIVDRITQVAQLIKDDETLKGQNTQLSKDNETLKGQNVQLSRQIKASGRGNEFPSCWVTPDGKPESIFELIISDTGIRIIDRPLPHRVKDKSQLPLYGVRYDAELPNYEFQTVLRPLYQWSIDHRCRFYVIIASSEYSAPISLVNAVNGFFYPDSKIQYRPVGQ